MVFRFYSKQLSNATKGLATGVLSFGLGLIVFGALILALPAIFVAIAAALFFLTGASVVGYAIKLFLAAKRMGKNFDESPQDAYRENVTIHQEEHHI